MVAWTCLAALAGEWLPDTPTRLFHVMRVALVLFMGMVLVPSEAWAGLAGFLLASVLAALVVAAHHVWGLPAWDIWGSLLTSRNNFSSGNMITMASACGVFFYLGISGRLARGEGCMASGAALALAVTVAFHAVSRNSQLLVVVLVLTAVFCRSRSLRSAMAGAVVVAVLVGSMWHFSPTTRNRFIELAGNLQSATVEANYGTSGSVRWRMYQEAVKGMVDHPMLGTGAGTWLPQWCSVWLSMDLHMPPEDRLSFAEINNPHNDFLLAGTETGVAGLLILARLLARFVQEGWRSPAVAGGITVVMGVSMFATALVNAPFRDAALGMTLSWLLAVSSSAQGGSADA